MEIRPTTIPPEYQRNINQSKVQRAQALTEQIRQSLDYKSAVSETTLDRTTRPVVKMSTDSFVYVDRRPQLSQLDDPPRVHEAYMRDDYMAPGIEGYQEQGARRWQGGQLDTRMAVARDNDV